MNSEIKPTETEIRDRFRAYLSSRHAAFLAEEYLSTADTHLNESLKGVDKYFKSLYEINDTRRIDSLSSAISNDPLKKSQFIHSEHPLKLTLKEYGLFLKSDFYPGNSDEPMKVPGEEEQKFEPEKEHNVMSRSEELLYEGDIVDTSGKSRRRSQELRRRCIEYFKGLHGGETVCECCGFNFSKTYGEIGDGYIEVHHLEPISTTSGIHPVDYQTKLVPLCSNCHSMIHRNKENPNGGVFTLEELKGKLHRQ